jgi:hypothetical protein
VKKCDKTKDFAKSNSNELKYFAQAKFPAIYVGNKRQLISNN